MGQIIHLAARNDWSDLRGLSPVEQVDVLKETVRQLREALAPVSSIHPSWGLTGRQSQIVAALVASTGPYLHKSRLYAALYGTDGEVDPKIVDVFICKIRKKLSPGGVRIGTVWGQGYYIAAGRELLLGPHPGMIEHDPPPPSPQRPAPTQRPVATDAAPIVTPSIERTVRALRAAGATPREIAAATALSRADVVHILARKQS